MNTNNIDKSLGILNDIKSNNIWSGSASTNMSETLSEIINALNKEKANINRFKEALDLLEELKKIDNEIVSLRNSYIDISIIVDIDMLKDAKARNSYISNVINTKTVDRDKLRNDILNILSEFGILADISIIDIPNLEVKDIEILYEYEMGCVCNFTASDGRKYEAYVPYQIDPTAPVIVYDSGGKSGITTDTSGVEWGIWNTYFEEHGFDHIMLRSTRSDNSYYYADLCEKLNLQPDSRLFIAWSGGYKRQFEEYYDLSMEQGSSPGVLAIMDSYVINEKKYIDKFTEDGTVLLCFYENNINHPAHNSYFKAGANEGLNMLIFRDTSEFGNSHGGIRDSLYENNVIDYLTGKGELPDNYVISYYNPSDVNADSKGYVTVDHSKVKTLDEVYEFFGLKR